MAREYRYTEIENEDSQTIQKQCETEAIAMPETTNAIFSRSVIPGNGTVPRILRL